ncbi:MAG: DUF3379 family protein [Pseudomonadota bacterium]
MTEMTYEQFCERIDQAPSEDFDGRAEKIASCEKCRAYADAALAFDAKLRAALEVTVPEIPMPDLTSPLEATVTNLGAARAEREARKPTSRRPYAFLALAASVVLAAVIGFRFLESPTAEIDARPELVAELLGHMDHERSAMRVNTTPASVATVSYVTSTAGTKVDDDIGLISYAHSCVVNGRTIPHLVIQGKNGPITLLIMPDEPVKQAVPFDDDEFHGVLVPVGETGSVAIIGRKGEPLDDIRESIADKIRLSI